MPERRTTRLVARLECGEDWFPRGISEVVSHTDEQYIAVNVARREHGRVAVLMREFRCDDVETCHAELRVWLQSVAAEGDDDLTAIRAWSERVADCILDALAAN